MVGLNVLLIHKTPKLFMIITSENIMIITPKHIIFVWFGLVWFYGISAIIGYLKPNPFLYI